MLRYYGLLWFRPTIKIALCGHATLASARVIFSTPEDQQADRLEFDTLSGTLVAKEVPGGSGKIELDFPASALEELTAADKLAQVSEVVYAAAGGCVSIRAVRKAGLFLVAEVDPGFDLEVAAVDDGPLVRPAAPNKKDSPRVTSSLIQSKFQLGAIILTPSRPTSFRPGARFVPRVFIVQSGVPEDRVCRSAHCALAPYWNRVLDIPPDEVIEARQVGKRSGDLDLIWEQENGRVRIQGSAVVTMRGELDL
ncbi:hypothetical protein M407DRAFT_6123 [Tulasnella calospora MUT 4182]|uniref:Uncharacterized protein n=1 Tax=Tulasnella calospora MUT 4182 TaxID=1051891 RepID=A0A0C3QEH5_9AGAM|nr:hypothetical protein M407DRAFT_6123 [Tulasnella calospora MUT 4182]